MVIWRKRRYPGAENPEKESKHCNDPGLCPERYWSGRRLSADCLLYTSLLANSGDRYNELSGYVEDSAGAMENMAKTMNDNLTGRITEFKSATEGTGIAIYEALGSLSLIHI